MLKVRVIPCMLFNGFNLVKTIQFNQLRNLGSPIQMARVYNSRNVDELIFLDLMATVENRPPAFAVIKDIIEECFMPLTVGGGIHSLEDVDQLMKIGADKISINSEALKNPSIIGQIVKKYGSQVLVIAIDAKLIDGQYFVFRDRGRQNTGKKVVDWIKEVETLGAGEIFLNSIDRDGMMSGYDIDLINQAVQVSSIPIIACGGAGKVQDIIDAVIKGQANAVSLASMFHYSGHTANSIKERMAQAGIPVRLIKK
ncbi:MAG: imidazole glycerol phosphate synthase subunit HisF [Candidatus Buchananbacteria bacterium RIFCSPHIGHO2_01_FULL_44_11]|uniref:imidazole glycerol-phosphate synthase n=1 Tax=Candidatus Buchananbacteria bacterium RIFCSPHIGHO2_01_FULL_44_11 TaxID=1797535 RepID=A0A1G1XZQ4_9BACT|nr:MAG: imidazole glycerol phosphate synthase subunit HisF [Candidatus Buchananbacteria bacterium RIFCSPHIGHO2_01_FULL_44_11]